MKYDRDALIAYVYDLYCVEQAIYNTEEAITILNHKNEEVNNHLEGNINDIKKNGEMAINKAKSSYIPDTYSKEVRFGEHKQAIILAISFLIIYTLGSVGLYKLFWTWLFRWYSESDWFLAIWVILGISLIIATRIIYVKEEKQILNKRKKKTEQKNERKIEHIDNIITSIENKISENINEASIEATNFSTKITSLTLKQNNQLEELKKMRKELYDSQLLIPFMHQNLRLIAYIYQYLITTTNTDLNYIFTQVNMKIIQDKLDEIIRNQNTMIIIQRRMLSELEMQTDILQKINRNLININSTINEFKNGVLEKLDSIHYDIKNINQDQQLILNNQAILYNQAMENAKAQSKTNAEINSYLKMIAHHTRVSSFFQRAEFLGIDYNRSWYDISLM